MKKSSKNLVKGGIETIILIVVLVAIVVGLLISTVMRMAGTTENLGTNVNGQLEENANEWMDGGFEEYYEG